MNTELKNSIRAALAYLNQYDIRLPDEMRYMLRAKGIVGKAASSLSEINAIYHDIITETLIDYFESGGSIVSPKKTIKSAMQDSFYDAFYAGWEAGGNKPPLTDEAKDWLVTRINQERGYIDMLMQNAKALRKEDDFNYFAWIEQRADGYTSSVVGVYNAGIMFAKNSKMLTWVLGPTEEHCKTCASLNGKRHRASWYLSRNYIPRQPGAAMNCGGYNCKCSLVDDNGVEVTL